VGLEAGTERWVKSKLSKNTDSRRGRAQGGNIYKIRKKKIGGGGLPESGKKVVRRPIWKGGSEEARPKRGSCRQKGKPNLRKLFREQNDENNQQKRLCLGKKDAAQYQRNETPFKWAGPGGELNVKVKTTPFPPKNGREKGPNYLTIQIRKEAEHVKERKKEASERENHSWEEKEKNL